MTREDRIQHIMQMMRDLTFERGVTWRKLGAEWGIGDSGMREMCAEASRRVKAELTNKDEVTVDVGVTLQRVMRKGLADYERDDDVKAGSLTIQAAQVWSGIVGIEAPKKVSLELAAKQRFEDMAPLDRAAEFRRMAAELVSEAERLEAAASELPQLPAVNPAPEQDHASLGDGTGGASGALLASIADDGEDLA